MARVQILHGYESKLPRHALPTGMAKLEHFTGQVMILIPGHHTSILAPEEALRLAEDILTVLMDRDGACPTVKVSE